MPGIVVASDGSGRPELTHRFERMLQASKTRPGQRLRREAFEPARVLAGRVDLGLLEAGAPVSPTGPGRLRGLLAGELLDRASLAASIAQAGVVAEGEDSLTLLLAAWRVWGWQATARFVGSFFFAVWDEATGTLYVGGDRTGTLPHAYSLEGERLLLAPEVAGVQAGALGQPRADLGGVFEVLAFEHPLGDRTLVEGVHIFPPGTILVLGPAGPRWHTWWRPRYRPAPAGPASLDAAVAAYGRAVGRCAAGPVGLGLSGGLDSRTVLACLGEPPPLFTFGEPGSEDVRLAARVAAAREAALHVLPLSPDYLTRHVDVMLRLGEGMVSLFHAHDADGLDEVAAVAPIVLVGITSEFSRGEFAENVLAAKPEGSLQAAGLLLRHLTHGSRPQDLPLGEEALVARLLARTWSVLTPGAATLALRPEAREAMARWLQASVARHLARCEGETLADRLTVYNLLHRQRRFSSWGLKIAQSTHEVRRPLDDPELLEVVLALPHAQRRTLQARVIREVAPALAEIPVTGTGAPLTAGRGQRAWALTRRRLAEALSPGRRQSFADPQRLLRTTARRWCEDVLLGAEVAEGGLLEPRGVRALVEAHMAGKASVAPALCALLTLELWRRHVMGGARLTPQG
ncbi:MAG: asparagine synthase-related protein [Candidatus Sericytochromatia bacterium]|nr:asparagine synthase-related protein [Candidatus Sericytochromatia bacterium]